jgi:hypothetical protein
VQAEPADDRTELNGFRPGAEDEEYATLQAGVDAATCGGR